MPNFFRIFCCALVAAVIFSLNAARAEDERQSWMSRISQAKERAAAAREKARAAFEERKLGPRRNDEIDQDKERSKRNSDDVLSDMTLRYGDIVSTTRGLFRFIGRGETEPSAGDFAPYSPDRGQTRTGP